MRAALAARKSEPLRQRWVVYDEAWRLHVTPRHCCAGWTRIGRLARHYGIANMLIFHKLSDLDTVGDSGSAMRALASSLRANADPSRLPTAARMLCSF